MTGGSTDPLDPPLVPPLVESCEVMNYTIPKNAKIHVSLWAMGRDPKVWDNPLSINPEKFMNSKVDFKGQNFELLPFGYERKIWDCFKREKPLMLIFKQRKASPMLS
ncbi:putative N-methylcoclaurine 3'-monooxygenase [Helianthus anomalus]